MFSFGKTKSRIDLVDLVPTPSNWNMNSEKILISLNKGSSEYKEVEDLVQLNNINCIHRVQNEYLYGRYLLKKKLYEVQGNYVERTLLHATWIKNVESIVNHNLDYRLVKRGKYGKGVSFTPKSTYANKEGCHSNGPKHRAMIVAKVLVGKARMGHYSMKKPFSSFDTTIKGRSVKKTDVIVKYYDDEFYPEYVVYYKY